MSQSYIIGVAGGSGSGKSTVARTIIEAMLPGSCAIIDHDSYYRDFSHLNFEERAALNFDHPDALETSLLASHLDELRAGRSFEKPVYDFRTHTRTPVTSTVAPARTVVVEGILVLASSELRARFDLMIFVETDADIRLMRRMRRDMVERGAPSSTSATSTSQPSAPCTSSSWSRASGTPTSCYPKGARTPWASTSSRRRCSSAPTLGTSPRSRPGRASTRPRRWASPRCGAAPP